MRLLLFSGGIDSTAIAWSSRPDALLFVDYGQRSAAGELRASAIVAGELGIPLDARRADLSGFGRGSLAGRAPVDGLPVENWPYRNQMLVTLAAMAYADRGLDEILVGTVSTDVLHPDGRPAFMAAIDEVVRVQGGTRVAMPARGMTTLELVKSSRVPRALLGWTFSCHTGEWACGQCRGCAKHDATIRELDGAVA